MNIEPLTAEHAIRLGPLESIHGGFEITPETAVALEEVGGKAAIDDDGAVIAIAGILPRWQGVGLAWAWLAHGWRRHARRITEEIIAELNKGQYHRVELGVKIGFARGERWAKMLGFELETPLAEKWGPDGENYSLWVRVM